MNNINFNTIRNLGICIFIVFTQNIVSANKLKSHSEKPNLLFIMTDQQRFDAMSCAGNSVIETPNMDRLAKEGVMFTNTYSANPVCVPSRAVFLTGLSSVNTHVESNGDYLNEDVPNAPTFDSILKKAGYSAEYYGKWHTPYQFAQCYDNDVYPIGNHHGLPHIITTYQEWLIKKGISKKEPGPGQLYSGRNQRPYSPVGPDYNTDKVDLSTPEKMKLKAKQSTQYGKVDLPPRISYAAYTAEETIDAIERLKNGPFTITCSFDPPHPPMVVQEPYFSAYPPETIPLPKTIDDSMENSPYKRRWENNDEHRYRNPENIKNMRSVYFGMVKEVDDWVGDILKKLDELGLTENTMVIFTSDHGELMGDHGLHSKSMFYEGAVHVPFLIRFPGRINAGTVIKEPVSTMDVCPTILDYLNQTIPECDGISLRPFVEGKKRKNDVVAYSTGNNEPNYMIRSGDLKLMMGQNENNNGTNALYNLKNDPNEMHNLLTSTSQKDQKQAKKMKTKLVKWMEKHEPHKAEGIMTRELK